MQFLDLSCIRILYHLVTTDNIGVLEPYLPSRGKTEEFLWWLFHEVILLYVEFTAEGNLSCACFRFLWVVYRLKIFCSVFGIVCKNDLYRVQNHHNPLSPPVQVFPEAMLKEFYLNHAVCLCHTDPVTERPDSPGCVAPSSEACDSWHPGIIPATYMSLFNKAGEFSLTEHCITQVEPCKLYLPGMIKSQFFEEPVVKGPVVFKLKGAE